MKTDFMKSDLPEMYSQTLNNKGGMIFGANYTDIIGYTTFAAVGDALRNAKSKDKPVAFVFKDETDAIIMGGKVQYRASEDAEHPEGNWEYVWSTDPEDFADCALMDLKDQMSQLYFVQRAGDKYGMEYKAGYLAPMHIIFVSCLANWLKDNVTPEQTAEIELENVFNARAEIENGETIISIEPIGKMVQLIKDDADLEV